MGGQRRPNSSGGTHALQSAAPRGPPPALARAAACWHRRQVRPSLGRAQNMVQAHEGAQAGRARNAGAAPDTKPRSWLMSALCMPWSRNCWMVLQTGRTPMFGAGCSQGRRSWLRWPQPIWAREARTVWRGLVPSTARLVPGNPACQLPATPARASGWDGFYPACARHFQPC